MLPKFSTLVSRFLCSMLLTCVTAISALADVCVSGAGGEEWNGTYVFDVGLGRYDLDSTHVLYNEFGIWVMRPNIGVGIPNAYFGANVSGVPEDSTYSVGPEGTPPAPAVLAGTCVPTPTATATPTPTPTNTPTASATPTVTPTQTATPVTTATAVPIVEPKCVFGDPNKTGSRLIGSYTRVAIDSTIVYPDAENLIIYDKIGGTGRLATFTLSQPFLGITINGSLKDKSNIDPEFSVSTYLSRYFANTFPVGFYSYAPPEVRNSEGEVVSGGKKHPIYLGVINGLCPFVVSTPAPTNTISGAVSNPSQGSVATQVSSESTPIYVLLFEGSTPTENSVPISGALADENGTFSISDVPDGDYHIKFIADGLQFSPDYVSVTALGGAPVSVPQQNPAVIDYNDTGCTVKRVGSTVVATAKSIVALKSKIGLQVSYLKRSGKKLLSAKKAAKFTASLDALVRKAEASVPSAQLAMLGFPSTARTKCPAANGCSSASLSNEVKSISGAAKKLNVASGKIKKAGDRYFTSSKVRSKNQKLAGAFTKLYKSTAKGISKLPKVTQTCPVL